MFYSKKYVIHATWLLSLDEFRPIRVCPMGTGIYEAT